MGYYSEIGIVFTAECHTHFQAQLAMQTAEVQKEVHELIEEATTHKK